MAEEEDRMLELIRRRHPLHNIAQAHGRSIKAIQLRFGAYCQRQIQNNRSLGELSEEFNTDASQITNYIDQLTTRNNSSGSNSNGSSLSSSGSSSEIAAIKEEISDMHARISKMGKLLKKFIETSSENQKEVKTLLLRQHQQQPSSKNEIKKKTSK